jgi:hypothetical protein
MCRSSQPIPNGDQPEQAASGDCKTDTVATFQTQDTPVVDAKESVPTPNATVAASAENSDEPWDWQKCSEKLMERVEELEKQLKDG